ncbi:acyl-ACP--UDP-N-acetylglucosamine O-acyltransferase [Caulobacter sp. SLTY]|uniref:acyl-ACP--UDP-N-acetylglucosamine O-acyltransferase n=1 Tax=Caulobacter sp. SLTY TaxID=2683262 RepID=UPI001411DB4D|nr:acyl-ACP--UDP-N-acetylglucosamine O-acyltransferase [Caulobacter sp. SLTY]NBB17230.1 acyl-ACP--UDP-N-acetylglucosamine O-acyltransferase [Caulobacter sp. SLTY]
MTTVHPTAIVDPGAQLGEAVEVGPYCIVGPDVTLGRGVKLRSHVVVEGVTTIGDDCVLHPFVNLGGPPQHLGHKGEPTRLEIGARNIFRENVTVHTGTQMGHGVTRIGDDCLLMVNVHVGHDAVIGNRVTMAPSVAIGGHAEVFDFVFLGGLAAVHQFTRIGRSAFIGGGGIVTKDVIPYGSVWGNHAHLEGLNLIGLKRRGFDRERINAMRAAYRLLFADEGTFQERIEDVAGAYSDIPEIVEILDFIRVDANRALCLPRREV